MNLQREPDTQHELDAYDLLRDMVDGVSPANEALPQINALLRGHSPNFLLFLCLTDEPVLRWLTTEGLRYGVSYRTATGDYGLALPDSYVWQLTVSLRDWGDLWEECVERYGPTFRCLLELFPMHARLRRVVGCLENPHSAEVYQVLGIPEYVLEEVLEDDPEDDPE